AGRIRRNADGGALEALSGVSDQRGTRAAASPAPMPGDSDLSAVVLLSPRALAVRSKGRAAYCPSRPVAGGRGRERAGENPRAHCHSALAPDARRRRFDLSVTTPSRRSSPL